MKEAYLILSGSDEQVGLHTVRVARTLENVIERWEPSTRLSPIYLLRSPDSAPEDNEFVGEQFLVFIGLVHPADVLPATDGNTEIWLTLGAFNVVIRVTSDAAARAILGRVGELPGVAFELWRISDGRVVATEFSKPQATDTSWRSAVAHVASLSVARELEELQREYCPLMASALARCQRTIPEIVSDLAKANEYVASKASGCPKGSAHDAVYNAFGVLTTINAGLSRFSSQAFSGTSPIVNTECHFWTHSLLGVAVANRALWRFASFIQRTLDGAFIPQRIAHFADVTPPTHADLQRVRPNDEYWYQDHLAARSLTEQDTNQPILYPVTFFSGRDGYKSTLYTLSAPLATIGACNSLHWSLLTLTHEICHTTVRGALGRLYPKATPEDVQAACSLLQRGPTSDLEALRGLLIQTLYAIHAVEEREMTLDRDPATLLHILDRWHHEVEEIIVHVCDFLYFYGGDWEEYVRSIWLSWSVIPDLGNRVHEYVLRTLCAVMARHLRRGPATEEAARDQVRAVLRAMTEERAGGEYITQALGYIDENWELLERRMNARRGLVKIARVALFSETVRDTLGVDLEAGSGKRNRLGYPHKVGTFTTEPIENPLRWVDAYTTALVPDVGHSLWMLYMLAFNVRAPHGEG